MAVLLDLLSPYPVLENIVSRLGIGDLFNLSKVNLAYRVALHGFGQHPFDEQGVFSTNHIRSALQIGQHRTAFWENLKARSQLRCSERNHVRGSPPTGCLLCSAPVCEACIIKAAFAKRNENTFQKRHRPLCSQCWYTGNQHKKHPIQGDDDGSRRPYPDRATDGEFCTCTAKNGHLCLDCKTKQNAESTNGPEICYGRDCPNGHPRSSDISMEGRICLWCSRQLPSSRSRAESRRNYDARHLLARSISSCECPLEEDVMDSFTEESMLTKSRSSYQSRKRSLPSYEDQRVAVQNTSNR